MIAGRGRAAPGIRRAAAVIVLLLVAAAARAERPYIAHVPGTLLADLCAAPSRGAWVAGSRDREALVAELDSDGRLVRSWSAVSPDEESSSAGPLVPASDGGAWVIARRYTRSGAPRGSLLLRFDDALGLRHSSFVPSVMMAVDEATDGGTCLAGNNGASSPRLVVARTDAAGVVRWRMLGPSSPKASAIDVAATEEGCVVLAKREEPGGAFDDAWIAAFDEAGEPTWQRMLLTRPRGLVETGDGRLLVVSQGTIDTVPFWTHSFDGADGSWLPPTGWRKYGSPGVDGRPAVGPDGGFFITGLGADGRFHLSTWGADPGNEVTFFTRHRLDLDVTVSDDWKAELLDGALGAVLPCNDLAGLSQSRVARLDTSGAVGPDCPAESFTGIEKPPVAFEPSTPADSFTVAAPPGVTLGSLPLVPAFFPLSATCLGPRTGPPGEVSPAGAASPLLVDAQGLRWEEASSSGSDTFVVYRGRLGALRARDYGECLVADLATPSWTDVDPVGPVGCWTYLVAGRNASGEGPLGFGSHVRRSTPAPTCP